MNDASTMNARLIFDIGGERRVIPVETFPFTLGRATDRHLCLSDPQVSREHACIDRDASGYLLRDMGSRHGTFVNGQPVTSARLHASDRITLGSGRTMLLFEEGDGLNTTRTLITQLSKTSTSRQSRNDLEILSLFLKAAQSLNTEGGIRDVLRTMLEYSIRLTGAERGFVFLGENADAFRLEYGQNREGEVILDQPAISYSIVRDAASSKLDFILSNATADAARGRESLILNAIRDVAAIPLRGLNSGRLLGLLYLDSHIGNPDFSRVDQEILHAIALHAATLLENLRMLEAERETALLRREIEIAAKIQRQIIPEALPDFPFAHLSARTVPCTGVGGDFYDVIPVPGGFVAVVADVCGKGIPAALLASMVQGMFHAQMSMQTAAGFSLVDAVQSVNDFVCSRTPAEKYLTLAILHYIHTETGEARIELVNAGHVSPLVVRANGCVETVEENDMPVGLLDFARFHIIPITLAIGDRMVLLSDGITEAEDPEANQFGMERVEPCLGQSDPCAALFHALEGFCRGTHQMDDQTVLSIHRTV
jgi:phosphoserine phosphatase RsbU/P